MAIDHQQLRYFVQVATLRSINKAAGNLHIAQSALSRRMRQIEYDLGVDLFHRSPKGVELTAAGRRLLGRAASLTDDFRLLREFVTDPGMAPSQQLHVGMVPGPTLLLLNQLVVRFHRAAPNIVLQIVEGTTQSLTEKVASGELEMAIVTDPPPHKRLCYRSLWAERLFLVRPPNMTARARMKKLPFVVPSQSPAIRAIIEQSMQRLGLHFHVDLEMPSSVSAKRLIASGGAYSIMPYSAIAEDFSSNAFAFDPVPDFTILRALASPQDRGNTAETDTLIGLMDELVAELIAIDPIKGLLPVSGRKYVGSRRSRADKDVSR
jgi:LysR family nitrogen assimilation transcriptional regulator